jgi:hypothetical protein
MRYACSDCRDHPGERSKNSPSRIASRIVRPGFRPGLRPGLVARSGQRKNQSPDSRASMYYTARRNSNAVSGDTLNMAS